MPEDRKLRLGGLWKGQTKSGETFYSGGLGPSLRMLVFKNNFKQGEKDPDLVIYLAPAEDNRQRRAPGKPDSGSELDEFEFPG